MKIIFFGTPEYVVPILEGLHRQFNHGPKRELVGVVTKPPAPVGRDKHIEYSEVDHFAHKHKIPIYFLPAQAGESSELPDADLGVCAAYGQIIPDATIKKFKIGILNIHPSLLPLYRGASPVQASLVMGEKITGISVLKMDAELDHGPIVSQLKEEVLETDTNESLRARLFMQSAQFLLDLIPNYVFGKIKLKDQDHSQATFSKPIRKEDGFIGGKFIDKAIKGEVVEEKFGVRFMRDYEAMPDAAFIERFIRALTPWPGTYTKIMINNEERRLKILKVHVENEKLVLDEVQLEGKNVVTWEQFKEGYPEASF